MSYVTPITDRTVADIAARNSKAFFNVADWTRIYGNALYVNVTIGSGTVPFTIISSPTTASYPSVANFNALIANIESMRLFVNALGSSIPSMSTLIWIVGAGSLSPTYEDINQWEQTIDSIKQFVEMSFSRRYRSGISVSGESIMLGNRWRHNYG